MKDGSVILIAEDDTSHFALMKKNLWRCCVHNDIVHFCDGRELLDFLFMRGNGPKMVPGTSYLLLLDINLSKITGIDVLRQIKSDQQLRKMPVIMLTLSDSQQQDVQKCYELGCNFFIHKPDNYNDFMQCVDQFGTFLSLPDIALPEIGVPSSIKGQNN